jgi:dipeptidase E
LIFLTSNGITSDNLFNKVNQSLGKNAKKAALVTTASVGYKEKDWSVPRHTEVLEKLGLSVDCFDFEEQDPELLEEYDAIFIIGGNPFYLLDKMRKSNCPERFKKYEKEKIIIGASAGSIVLGNTIALIYEFDPQMNDIVGLNDFTGLGLTNINVCPHVSKYIDRYDRFLERIEDFEKCYNVHITRINDGQAVFISDDETIII